MQCRGLVLKSAVFSLLATWPAAAQEAVKEPARPAIEQIVREYILQHPEVLIESFRLYDSAARDLGRPEIRAHDALARARLLDFGDDGRQARRDVRAQRGDETTRRRSVGRACGHIGESDAGTALVDLFALAREDALQDVGHGLT